MTSDQLDLVSAALCCPVDGCDAHVAFTARRNGGTPVRETCPGCGSNLTLQAGTLRPGPLLPSGGG